VAGTRRSVVAVPARRALCDPFRVRVTATTLLWFAVLAAACGSTGAEGDPPTSSSSMPTRPIGVSSFVAVTRDRFVVELDAHGTVERTLTRLDGPARDGVSLVPDRTRAYVAVRVDDGGSSWCTSKILEVDGAGRTREVARGISPVVSREGVRLAYATTSRVEDICYVTALVVTDLATHASRRFELEAPVPDTGPPDWHLSWSPAGDRLVYRDSRDNTGVRVLHVDRGQTDHLPIGRGFMMPTFVDDTHLAGLRGCCTGPQRVVIADVATGAEQPWFTLDAPPEVLQALPRREALVVTAENHLQHETATGVVTIRDDVIAAGA